MTYNRYLLVLFSSIFFVSCQTQSLKIDYEIQNVDQRVEITHVQILKEKGGFSLRASIFIDTSMPVKISFQIFSHENKPIFHSSIMYRKRYKMNEFSQSFLIETDHKLRLLIIPTIEITGD